ncbi:MULTISPECIES: hypothetical protein [unclassified Empedobacter]|uniref:hypothetical protein n=1 Tax=unclassified Empedobacter TaxID=2643773 RepID=UPI0025C44DB3|nr:MULTISPECIES: hypothetical protein [unclassified Empedobacter]
MSEFDYKKFLSKEETIANIKELKKIRWPLFGSDNIDDFVNDIKSQLFKFFPYLPSPLKLMSTDDFKINFYRVRDVSQFNNIDLVCEHSYPPIAFTGHGRCNFPQNPIFYSSNNPFISLSEVIRGNEYKDKRYCISVWKIKNDTL